MGGLITIDEWKWRKQLFNTYTWNDFERYIFALVHKFIFVEVVKNIIWFWNKFYEPSVASGFRFLGTNLQRKGYSYMRIVSV